MTPRPSIDRSSVTYFQDEAHAFATLASDSHNPHFTDRYRVFRAWIDRVYDPQLDRRQTCLDLGCGPGTLTVAAAERGFRTIGVDGAEAMLRLTRRAAEERNLDVELAQRVLPLSSDAMAEWQGTTDLVIASSVIEYVDDDTQFIEQCRELLAPGGIMLVSFANRSAIRRFPERWIRFSRSAVGSAQSGRKHWHSLADARRLFAATRLNVVGEQYFALPPLAYPVWRSSRRPNLLCTLFLVAAQRPEQGP
jgi:2-polyprenyl-3-methyl-5-hydroxy-6-metoxy-1,4-benzoquinol methylase